MRTSRTPPGVRGLKQVLNLAEAVDVCRTPPGARGLKLKDYLKSSNVTESHPTRGAWIETFFKVYIVC